MSLYSDLQPLSEIVSADLRLLPTPGFRFAAGVTEIPVHAFELQHLVPALPLAIRMDEAGPGLVAITGVAPEHNMFVGPRGGWNALATPSALQTYPFAMRSDASGHAVVCADMASSLLDRHEDGEPLVTDTGDLGPAVAGQLAQLRRQLRDRTAVATALRALWDANVLAPWSVPDVPVLDPDVHFYVKFQALARLPAATQAELARVEALPLAYAQAYAIGNMRRLRAMAPARRASAEPAPSPPMAPALDDDVVLDFG